MAEMIPVTPSVLKWARTSMGLSIIDVAEKMSKSEDIIKQWERGEKSPTYRQLRQLAYEIYKRPLALFFLPSPPEEDGIEKSFRTLPNSELKAIPPRIHYLLRLAKVRQFNLAELYREEKPTTKFILEDLSFSSGTDIEKMASDVRSYLNVREPGEEQFVNSDETLKYWRNLIINHGIFIFKENFRGNIQGKAKFSALENKYSGFCLFDEKFPVIYLNNNNSKNRQIFTIFHELGHLLMQSGGIDKSNDEEYINLLSGEERDIEVLCNEFAAEFLVPMKHLEKKIKELSIEGFEDEEENIQRLANIFNVSREVIFRRCVDMGRVSRNDYNARKKVWDDEFTENQSQGGGGNYYYTQVAYLGEKYIDKVFELYDNDEISTIETADFLKMKVENFAGLREAAGVFGGQ